MDNKPYQGDLSERMARLEQKVGDGFHNIESRLDEIVSNSDLKVIVSDYNSKIDKQNIRINQIETTVQSIRNQSKAKTIQATAIASILSIIITYLVTYFLEDISNK